MKKLNIFATCMLGLASLGFMSCSDQSDEITSIIYDRNFSPTDFETSSATENSIKLAWVASQGATSYTVEVFENDSLEFIESNKIYTTTIDAASEDGAATQSKFTLVVSGLVYDTKYSARVNAITSGDESRTSKWTEVYFRTSAQQIFESVNEEDVADRSVNLRWPAGEEVTSIRATDADGKVVATKTLTAEEIAAGAATVDGLSPETKYTINLYNGEKERGSRTITTIADLNGATLVRANENLGDLVKDAEDGTVFALYGGTFIIPSEDDETLGGAAVVSKSITIKGIYPTNIPTIKGRFQIEDGASLTINQVVLDGSENATTDQAFNFKTADAAYGVLDVQNTEIKGYVKGVYYFNVAATIESISFKNCLIHDITCEGGDCFDARKGLVKNLSFSNSTIYNCAQDRDFIRMDKNSGSYTETSKISLTNCTIDNVCNNTAKKRFFYVRFNPAEITMTNCIVSNTLAVFSNQSTTPVPTFKSNYYSEVPNLQKLDVENKVNYFIDESGKTEDPEYADAENGDFTLENESLAKLGVGDPRWIK